MKNNEAIVHLGDGVLHEVGRILKSARRRRILFVVDEAAYAVCNANSILESAFSTCTVTRFSGFELNPKLSDILRGIRIARDCQPNLVIALGGGTAIDLAKLVASLSMQSAAARDIITGRAAIEQDGPPVMAIPTTAGTGSEATHFAVAYVDDQKHSVAHETLLPDYAIIDPLLTNSLPADITAATGLDALCQAIESIWAVGSTKESAAYATNALRYAWKNLVPAVLAPTPESRLAMCRASHLAGQAINISKTTASHALSYPLTSHHGIPHGIAVAATLSQMLAYNSAVTETDCLDPRGAAYVHRQINTIVELLGANDVNDACQRFENAVSRIHCYRSLQEAGITTEDQLRHIVDSVNRERMSNNPRLTSSESLMQLFSVD